MASEITCGLALFLLRIFLASYLPKSANQFDETRIVEEISSYTREFPCEDRMSLLQYLDLRLYLQEAILVKVDRASMANSLEVRAPFLDHELVEFVMGLPSDLKLRGFTSKYLLKKAAEAYLPTEIIQRKKKGFGVPIAKWIKGPLKELFMDMLSFDRIKREGFLNPAICREASSGSLVEQERQSETTLDLARLGTLAGSLSPFPLKWRASNKHNALAGHALFCIKGPVSLNRQIDSFFVRRLRIPEKKIHGGIRRKSVEIEKTSIKITFQYRRRSS